MGRRKGANRAHNHHALNAKVQHPGTFGDEFTQRGKDQRCCRSNDRQQNGLKHIHYTAPSLDAPRLNLTRIL
ncbi:hypothetical protein D3C72_2150790 [compost metagenome]